MDAPVNVKHSLPASTSNEASSTTSPVSSSVSGAKVPSAIPVPSTSGCSSSGLNTANSTNEEEDDDDCKIIDDEEEKEEDDCKIIHVEEKKETHSAEEFAELAPLAFQILRKNSNCGKLNNEFQMLMLQLFIRNFIKERYPNCSEEYCNGHVRNILLGLNNIREWQNAAIVAKQEYDKVMCEIQKQKEAIELERERKEMEMQEEHSDKSQQLLNKEDISTETDEKNTTLQQLELKVKLTEKANELAKAKKEWEEVELKISMLESSLKEKEEKKIQENAEKKKVHDEAERLASLLENQNKDSSKIRFVPNKAKSGRYKLKNKVSCKIKFVTKKAKNDVYRLKIKKNILLLEEITLMKNKEQLLKRLTLKKNKQQLLKTLTIKKNKQQHLKRLTLMKNKQQLLKRFTLMKNKQELLKRLTLIKNKQELLLLLSELSSVSSAGCQTDLFEIRESATNTVEDQNLTKRLKTFENIGLSSVSTVGCQTELFEIGGSATKTVEDQSTMKRKTLMKNKQQLLKRLKNVEDIGLPSVSNVSCRTDSFYIDKGPRNTVKKQSKDQDNLEEKLQQIGSVNLEAKRGKAEESRVDSVSLNLPELDGFSTSF